MSYQDTVTAMRDSAKLASEREWEAMLRDYMSDGRGRKYRFGGILNTISSVITTMQDFAENADDLGMNREALEFAIDKLEAVYAECDLNYGSRL